MMFLREKLENTTKYRVSIRMIYYIKQHILYVTFDKKMQFIFLDIKMKQRKIC